MFGGEIAPRTASPSMPFSQWAWLSRMETRWKVSSYNDEDFGFLRLTVDKNQKIVTGEFFAAFNESNPNANLPILSDSFVLRLEKHTID